MALEGYGEGYEMAVSELITKDAQISALKPDPDVAVKRYAIQSKHGGGLKIEVRANGLKRFVYRYKIVGKESELLLGSYPAMTLAKARQEHAKAVALVKSGINPRHSRIQEKTQNEQMPILSELFQSWLALRIASKPISPRTLTDYNGTYQRYLEKALGNTRACDLTRSVIYEHLTKVRETSSEGVRKGLIILNMALDHAVLQGHIEINPARLLKPAMFGASMGKPRERWLPQNELRMLWLALEQATLGGGSVAAGGRGIASSSVLSPSMANALRLIILTGVRRSEAIGMRWEQINGDRWVIPQTKNQRSHVVTLHPLSLSLLKQQQALSQSQWVFESTSKPDYPITGDAIHKALGRIQAKYLGELDNFCVHDLRRSVATGSAEYLDAPERLIELLLNHVPKNRLIRTYQVGQQAEKIRNLFLRWGDFIQNKVIQDPSKQIDNGKVVTVNFGHPRPK